MSQSSFISGVDRRKRPFPHLQHMLRFPKPSSYSSFTPSSYASSSMAKKKPRAVVSVQRGHGPEGVRRFADLLLEGAAQEAVAVAQEGVQALRLYFDESSRRGKVNLFDFVDGLSAASDVKYFMGREACWHLRFQLMQALEDVPPETECTWEHLLFIIRSRTRVTLEEPAPVSLMSVEQYRQLLAEVTEQEDYKHPPPIVLPPHVRNYAEEIDYEMERLERLEEFVPRPDEHVSTRVQDWMEHPQEHEIVLPQVSDDEEEQLLLDPVKQAAHADRFVPLDDDASQAVVEALGDGPDDEVLISKFNVDMTREKMACLRPQTWLNDEVINFYMKMLQERDDALCSTRDRRPSFYNNSFFMSKLVDESGYRYANVRRWTRKVDIFEKDKIFIPVNIGNFHWTLTVIFMTKKRIVFYDSMGGGGEKYLQALKQYLIDEAKDKKQMDIDLSDWTLRSNGKNIPKQNNSYDCGVFTCAFTDFLSDDVPLHFSQSDIRKWRHKIAHAILQGRIEYRSDR